MRGRQDIAEVRFDDLPDAPHLFPFLPTMAALPVYYPGTDAANLLLRQLDAEATLKDSTLRLGIDAIPCCLSRHPDSANLATQLAPAPGDFVTAKQQWPGNRLRKVRTQRPTYRK
jgi:hypothetical protein